MNAITATLTLALLTGNASATHATPLRTPDAQFTQAAPPGTRTQSAPPAVPKQRDTVTIEAKGVGHNRQDAIDQGLRTAVMSAVGGIVDAETVTENDRIVKDRIRQLSGGVVERYDVISETPGADSYMVMLRATISRQAIIDAFGDIIEGKAKVSGKNLVAKRKAMKRAGQDLLEAVVPAAQELVAAPFAVSLSEEAFSNIMGHLPPEDADGLVTPLVLSIDVKRWNRLATGLIERLKAFSPPVEETPFHVRTWQLTDSETAAHVRELAERIKGGADAQEAMKAAGYAGIWMERLISEARWPVIRAVDNEDSPMLNLFHVCGFHPIKPDTGIDALSVTDTSTRSPNPAVLGVVSDLSDQSAKITYFRLGQPAIASIVGALGRQTTYGIELSTRLEVELISKDGQRVNSASKVVTSAGSTDDRQPFVVLGAKPFAGSEPEDVIALIPGCVSLKRNTKVFDMSTATVVPAREGGTSAIDTAWFGAVRCDFSEAEIDATEEVRVRCVSLNPRAESK
jgi:hypothetical protein